MALIIYISLQFSGMLFDFKIMPQSIQMILLSDEILHGEIFLHPIILASDNDRMFKYFLCFSEACNSSVFYKG